MLERRRFWWLGSDLIRSLHQNVWKFKFGWSRASLFVLLCLLCDRHLRLGSVLDVFVPEVLEWSIERFYGEEIKTSPNEFRLNHRAFVHCLPWIVAGRLSVSKRKEKLDRSKSELSNPITNARRSEVRKSISPIAKRSELNVFCLPI